MAEATEETTVAEHVTVVTNENFGAYVDKQLGVNPEAQAAEELAKVDEEKAAQAALEDDPAEEFVGDAEPHKKLSKKEKLNARFKELTDARKEADAKAAAKEAEAKQAREEREAIERERNELKAKYEPPKTDELGPKPELSAFATAADYEKAMEDWTGDKVRIETAARQREEHAAKEAETVRKNWDERLKATREEIEDYAEVVGGSEVKVSDQVRDAIIESEFGPKILYHLAKNPDVAEKIAGLTVGKALKEIGRLEATLGDRPQTKSETKVAEISKAPPPINPLKSGTAAVGTLKGTDVVPANMSYDEWKKRRQAGKIQ